MITKQQLIVFLENRVLQPAENHPMVDEIIKRKIRATRMRLYELPSAEKVETYFWSAMASDRGIDSYERLHYIGAVTFEDVRMDFKQLCERV